MKPTRVNDLYQAAFADLSIPDHRRHFMLAVLDCSSRYLLVLRVCSEPTAEAMAEGLKEALDEARKMSHLEETRLITLVADCGSVTPEELTKCIFGMPFVLEFPTNRTFQSFAMIRRLTWTVRDEEISINSYRDPNEAQRSLERFRHTYNFERPHQTLGYRVPADLFCRTSGYQSIH